MRTSTRTRTSGDEEYVNVEDDNEEEEHVEEDDDEYDVEDDEQSYDVVEGKASTAVASRASSKRNHRDEDSLAMVQSASSKCRKLSSTAAASSVTGE